MAAVRGQSSGVRLVRPVICTSSTTEGPGTGYSIRIQPRLLATPRRAADPLDTIAAQGSSLGYVYDFGDGWEHEVAVEQVLPALERHPSSGVRGSVEERARPKTAAASSATTRAPGDPGRPRPSGAPPTTSNGWAGPSIPKRSTRATLRPTFASSSSVGFDSSQRTGRRSFIRTGMPRPPASESLGYCSSTSSSTGPPSG